MSYKTSSIVWLNSPPAGISSIPTKTRNQLLPFGDLHWDDFERLCYRLARSEENIEHCQLYGKHGDKQDGIDIYTRVYGSEKYKVFQCKKVEKFGPSKIQSAVVEFMKGDWFKKSDVFCLCTQENLQFRSRLDELEKQAKILKTHGISLRIWDKGELSSKLKLKPEIVDDFFGREWVKAFCGEEVTLSLGERLDNVKLKKLRSDLHRLYQQMFNIHDKGIPIPSTITLVERYVIPDIEEGQTIVRENPSPQIIKPDSDFYNGEEKSQKQFLDIGNRRYIQRTPIQNWISRNKRSLLFGNPGSGKSTFLRYLALDLLSEEPRLNIISEKWGAYIPLLIPFALWTKVVNNGQAGDRSLRGIIEDWLKGWDAEDIITIVKKALRDKRLLLLVDGLDEYSNEDSAKIALGHLDSFLSENDISIIATSRLHGFEKLSMRTDGWQRAEMADFLIEQQRNLVRIWFNASFRKINPNLTEEETSKGVEGQTTKFISELGRSNELRELAKNPLLLCLLIYFQLSNSRLPLGRFEAYGALTDYLIFSHPQTRRVAAEVPQQGELLSPRYIKNILAYFAFILHSKHQEGLLNEENVLDVIIEFLVDGEQGLGMDKFLAKQKSIEFLELAEKNLGILVRRSRDEFGFFHRTIQEYLTSYNISRISKENQLIILDEYCTNPLWREVILGFFRITKQPNDIKLFLDKIENKIVSYEEKNIINEIISEVVFNDYNCPPEKARKLAQKSYEEIELGTWRPHRIKILKNVLNGLNSPILSSEIKEKLTTWFPDRLGYNRSYLFLAMSNWKKGTDLLDALFKGINAEDYKDRISAGSALAKIYGGDVEISQKLIKLIEQGDDISLSAAAMEALLKGWLNNEKIDALLEWFVSSPTPLLQLVGIRGKIKRGTQSNRELDRLLRLASWQSGLYLYSEDIVEMILMGWPRSEKVKKVCFKSIYNWEDRDNSIIDRNIAQSVILYGYPNDQQVIDFCIKELKEHQHPFSNVLLDRNAFEAMALNFKDNTKLIIALEDWAENNKEYRNIEVSYAALVGRTKKFKNWLIEDLQKNFPFWAAKALLKGWGTSDAEVSQALLAQISKPASVSSDFAFLLPQIITDKEQCWQRLFEIFNDPSCRRYDFVMDGFAMLGKKERDSEIIEIALSIAKKLQHNKLYDIKSRLIVNYKFDNRVRELAIETLRGRDESFDVVATAYGDDEEIRRMILNIANPLPSVLRLTIATYLSEAEIDGAFTKKILHQYDHEMEVQVKVQASIGFYTAIKNSEDKFTDYIEQLKNDITCYGHDYSERRLAAFCGLLILNKLEIMLHLTEQFGTPADKVSVDGIRGLHPNIPYIRFILGNWAYLKSYFVEEFWTRLFRNNSDLDYIWGQLARFGDEYESPRKEILEYLESKKKKSANTELLQFLGRAKPNSTILLEYCMNTLGLGKIAGGQSNENSSSYIDKITAANLIGDQFYEDTEVLKLIEIESNKTRKDDLILVLSEGWPNSSLLRQLLLEIKQNRRLYRYSIVIRYDCIMSAPVIMYRRLLWFIRYIQNNSEIYYVEEIIRPLTKRLLKDDILFELLLQHINACPRASEKISIPKLLEKVRGLTPELKNWCHNELIVQMEGHNVESGFDITTGNFSSVPAAIYEILNNS